MTKNRFTTDELVKCFILELNKMPLDFPCAKWAENAIRKASEQYYSCGRKGTFEKYAEEIYKAMKKHPAATVHTDYAAEWVSGEVEKNTWHFDTCLRV